jgi:sialate O-acetylesterase
MLARISLAGAVAAGIFAGTPDVSRADVMLPALFSDNMVIQQRAKIAVWGKADPKESVTVQLGGDQQQTVAAKDGSWSVKLEGIKSGGPYELTVSGKNSVSIHNVAIGDVWVCGGESNMEFKTIAARNSTEEMADADLPMVRVFVVKHDAEEKPAGDAEGAWVVCDPGTVKDFSAIGFFFAREINRGQHMPIGLIESAWGPSPIEAWMPRAALEKDAALKPVLDRYEAAVQAYPAALDAFKQKVSAWQDAAASAKATGSPTPRMPISPLAPGGEREPSALYNGMISPLLKFGIRGVLWYQGESNTSDPGLYAKLFPAMIQAWRAGWGEGDVPFLYAQLAGFMARQSTPGSSPWAELREAQEAALKLPKTGMAVTADTSEEHEMHPANKQDVAHRLALLAEKIVYGEPGTMAAGPAFAGMQIENGAAVLTFRNADGGLVATSGSSLGFSIAGADGNFVWANATVRGQQVTVQSPDVPQPTAVRYGWANFPVLDLFNKAGLPAGPFRTDETGRAAEIGGKKSRSAD